MINLYCLRYYEGERDCSNWQLRYCLENREDQDFDCKCVHILYALKKSDNFKEYDTKIFSFLWKIFNMQSTMGNAQRLVVGISGISGSGKTTLTKLLADELDATAIFWDDFDDISKSPEDYVAWFESGSPGGADAWDYPLLADTIRRLQFGETVISPATKEKLESKKWIVFDAPLGRDHKQTAHYIDFWIHLDTPLDIALGRRVLRDFNAQTPTQEILENIRFYLEKSRPMFTKKYKESADMIVDGSKATGIIAQEIINSLKKKYTKQFTDKQNIDT